MSSLLLYNGRVIDPATGMDQTGSLLVVDGKIAELGSSQTTADQVIDCSGKIISPGLIDTHVAIRDPGFEEDETTATATSAALAGGFTAIASLPDTNPPVDNAAAAEYVILQAARARNCRVYPLGAVTREHAGQELADMGQLSRSGAVGFTDAKTPIASAEIMRRALEYSRMFGCPVLSHPQDPSLTAGGVMHEGLHSTLLGLRGMPAAAETIVAGRDIALAELTRGRVHLMSITTAGTVDQVRRAKQAGLSVTADVTPHHLTLSDDVLSTYHSAFKVDPPLRSHEHIAALIAGLKDGTIDAISADHQPWASEKKDREFDQVPFGVVGLETLLPICLETLVEPGHLTWLQLLACLTTGPARILGIPGGRLAVGAAADITVIDPQVAWTIDPACFRSRGRNTPFAQRKVKGRATLVLVDGEIRYQWQA